MSPDLSRDVFNSLLPPGSIWSVKDEDDFDLLLNGIGENNQYVLDFLSQLAFVRDCKKTSILSDLEKELGLQTNLSLSETVRRERACAAKTSRSGFGKDFMQDKFQAAGFDVQVHINDPPVDPDIFLVEGLKIFCNDQVNAFCGNQNAICGGVIVENPIVNGDFFEEEFVFSIRCNSEFAVSGSNRAFCGSIDALKRTKIEYKIPNVPGYWGLFFFVGGDATRNIAGELINIDPAIVPINRKDELKRLILQFKPLHSWGGLIVTYV